MRTTPMILTAIALGASLRSQDPTRLIELLSDPERQSAASDQLRALGAEAVEPLLAAIVPKSTDAEQITRTRAVLVTLSSMRSRAGTAIAPLMGMLGVVRGGLHADFMRTVGDLVLYAPIELETLRSMHRDGLAGVIWTSRMHREDARMRIRREIGSGLDAERAIQLLGGVRAWSLEAALDYLIDRTLHANGAHSVRDALPQLTELLERPDPTITATDAHVPLRIKAAELVLAAAPRSTAAELATAVLHGDAPAKPIASRSIPQRFAERLDQLTQQLRDPEHRQAATANLIAFGAPAAKHIIAALAVAEESEAREEMLHALQRMGREAAHVAPDIRALFWQLPLDHTESITRALAATGVWSRDMVNVFTYSATTDRMTWDGRHLPGECTSENYGGAAAGYFHLQAALAIDPLWPPELLANQLDSPVADRRLHALDVLRQRGAESLPVLDAIAEAMDTTDIEGIKMGIRGRGFTVKPIDRSREVQRAAAQAFLAIAPPGDPRRNRAKKLIEPSLNGR